MSLENLMTGLKYTILPTGPWISEDCSLPTAAATRPSTGYRQNIPIQPLYPLMAFCCFGPMTRTNRVYGILTSSSAKRRKPLDSHSGIPTDLLLSIPCRTVLINQMYNHTAGYLTERAAGP